MERIAIGESIRFGWETLKRRPLVVIGGFALAMIVSALSSALLDPGEGAPVTFMSVVIGLISMGIGLLVEIGLVTFAIRAHDNVATVQVQDLWNPKPFLSYLVAQIAVGIGVVIGLILLIVPGVILALGWMFASYLIVDKGRGPIEAMKESWHLTKGNRGRLFLFVLALLGINILGLLALVVGLLVSIPVSMLAVTHVYRKLSQSSAPMQTA